jgi:hypothetical protein
MLHLRGTCLIYNAVQCTHSKALTKVMAQVPSRYYSRALTGNALAKMYTNHAEIEVNFLELGLQREPLGA